MSDVTFWRSLDDDDADDDAPTAQEIAADKAAAVAAAARGEGQPGLVQITRRGFLATLGASSAVGLAACARRPVEKILPFAERPEDRVPGTAVQYATAMHVGGGVLGLLVESYDGRPIKIEGNPKHPASRGAASAWAQAAIRELYDNDRSTHPLTGGRAGTWDGFFAFADAQLKTLAARAGQGLALLCRGTPSPTLLRLLGEARTAYPRLRLYVDDAAYGARAALGLRLAGAPNLRPRFHLDQAAVVVALDSDLLGSEGDAVRHGKELAAGRRVQSERDPMNRLYVVEPSPTVTGLSADHRLALPAQAIGPFLQALGRELFAGGLAAPAGAGGLAAALRAAPPASIYDEARLRLASGTRWIGAVARDLLKHRGRSLLVVGERQPAAVHALAHALNAALGNLDHTVALVPDPIAGLEAEPLASLAAALGRGAIDTLCVLGGNPVYEAPADLRFAAALGQARVTIHLGHHADETGRRCTWHLPLSHPLESWGDLRATDGTAAIVQPLIAPLFDTRSEVEVLARLLGRTDARGYDLVRATWQQERPGPDFDRRWSVWLADGVVGDSAAPPAAPRLDGAAVARALATLPAAPAPGPADLELDFHVDSSVLDGRYANNAWLQEWPDPVTKLVWDNAALIAPQTAKTLGVKTGDLLALAYRGRGLQVPVFVQPGQAERTVSLALGYGRAAAGRYGDGKGVNANTLRDSSAPWFDRGLTATPVLARYQLATTQRHGQMEGRPVLREATHAQYQQTPDFAARQAPPHPPLKSLWKKPNPEGGLQWGMAIDLTTCTGCSACVLACQAENNIPVVGKDQVLRYREMHWLRVDRYYKGSADAPEMSVQPVPCMQCETAPCESVCPVVASVHSPEGLNDQVYNRCIGTRYCSNNCPYKVRHFNFYHYTGNLTLLDQMYQNPQVTVRARGVMEKCTYCVQRITAGKIAAKRAGTDEIRDGAITPACAQTCPADAIVFGNINDPQSRVAQLKAQNRNYALLEELNTQPRTTYLAKLRNPNPELA